MTRAAPVGFDAPQFPLEAALLDPCRGAEEAAARRRDAGYMAGYAAGREHGEAEVARAIEDHRRNAGRLTELTSALEQATAELERRDAVALADIEADVVALAVAMASEIVGRELAVVAAPVVDSLTRALRLVPDRGRPVVYVHPDDEGTAREAVAEDVVRWPESLTVRPDPGIERGACVIDVDHCRIDAQIGPALDRVRAALDLASPPDLLAPAPEPEQSVP